MKTECDFPGCPEAPENDGMCVLHQHVRVSTTGSWIEDDTHHHLPKGRV